MSKLKNGGLDQYGAEPFEQHQFRTAGVEGDIQQIKIFIFADSKSTPMTQPNPPKGSKFRPNPNTNLQVDPTHGQLWDRQTDTQPPCSRRSVILPARGRLNKNI